MPLTMQTRWGGGVLVAGALLVCLALSVMPCRGQNTGSPVRNPAGGQQAHIPGHGVPPEMNPVPALDKSNPMAQQKWKRMLNQNRHNSIVADTRKLLRLTAELKAEIVRSHATGLTEAELSKVAAIQKLAHNIRQNMALTFEPGPVYSDQQLPPYMQP